MVTAARAALCLCVWLFVSEVSGSYIPAKMNKTIHSLLQHYKISAKERFNGKPIFSKELFPGNAEMKKVFLAGVLETYEKLLDHMLRAVPTASPAPQVSHMSISTDQGEVTSNAISEDVRDELNYILTKVKHLKHVRYGDQQKLLHGLRSLRHIQMDSQTVQSKALWELPWLYEEASMLSDIELMQRRRRRQLKARSVLRG